MKKRKEKVEHEFIEIKFRPPTSKLSILTFPRLLAFLCIKEKATWRELMRTFVENPELKTTKQTLNVTLNQLIEAGWVEKVKDEAGKYYYKLKPGVYGMVKDKLKKLFVESVMLFSAISDEIGRLQKALEINDLKFGLTLIADAATALNDKSPNDKTLKDLYYLIDDLHRTSKAISEKIKEIRAMKEMKVYSTVEFRAVIVACLEAEQKASLALRRAIDLHRAAKLISDQEALRLIDKINEADQRVHISSNI